MRRKKRKRTRVTLIHEQLELVAQFADYTFDHPRLSFDEVARKVLPKGFGTGPRARLLRREVRHVFAEQRAS